MMNNTGKLLVNPDDPVHRRLIADLKRSGFRFEILVCILKEPILIYNFTYEGVEQIMRLIKRECGLPDHIDYLLE